MMFKMKIIGLLMFSLFLIIGCEGQVEYRSGESIKKEELPSDYIKEVTYQGHDYFLVNRTWGGIFHSPECSNEICKRMRESF